ncbi:MAG: acetyl-CoA carboxylase biotin carboxyl carrier protein subunit [Deltaproteobacteria bacterium]|nr:acetyl-CoA carboxylase biotin carboxyl carrier protein subunit [Deltaproteobacteria bacterium]
MRRILRVADQRHEVLVLPSREGRRLLLGRDVHPASLRALGGGEYRLEVDGMAHRAWIAVRGDAIHVHVGGRSWTVECVDELAETAAASGGASDTAEAPMPGTVVRVMVETGHAVRRGQTLVVIESMKMETAIVAWRDGVVAAVHRPLGSTFDRRAPLVSLEPEPSS